MILTKLKPEEVQLLASLPTRATGNWMQEIALSFDELAGKVQLTQLCEKAYFQYLVAAGNSTKFDQMGTTDGDYGMPCMWKCEMVETFVITNCVPGTVLDQGECKGFFFRAKCSWSARGCSSIVNAGAATTSNSSAQGNLNVNPQKTCPRFSNSKH